MDDSRLQALRSEVLDWRHKAVPPAAQGRTLADWLASGPGLDELDTPVVTLELRRDGTPVNPLDYVG